jgi:hypothetical protein
VDDRESADVDELQAADRGDGRDEAVDRGADREAP